MPLAMDGPTAQLTCELRYTVEAVDAQGMIPESKKIGPQPTHPRPSTPKWTPSFSVVGDDIAHVLFGLSNVPAGRDLGLRRKGASSRTRQCRSRHVFGDDRDIIILIGDAVQRTGAIVNVPVVGTKERLGRVVDGVGPPIGGGDSLEKCSAVDKWDVRGNLPFHYAASGTLAAHLVDRSPAARGCAIRTAC
jgi:hypothetical protein